jgi:hypothetical protein
VEIGDDRLGHVEHAVLANDDVGGERRHRPGLRPRDGSYWKKKKKRRRNKYSSSKVEKFHIAVLDFDRPCRPSLEQQKS